MLTADFTAVCSARVFKHDSLAMIGPQRFTQDKSMMKKFVIQDLTLANCTCMVLYKSNKPHFLRVYRHYKPMRDVGRTEENIGNHMSQVSHLQALCSDAILG